MINFFCHIELDIWIDSISPLLVWKDLVRADTAFLFNAKQQQEFRSRLQPQMFSNMGELPVCFYVARWLQRVDISPRRIVFGSEFTDGMLDYLQSYGQRSECVSFEYCHRLSHRSIQKFMVNCSSASHLVLRHCDIGNELICEIAKSCSKMISLTIEGILCESILVGISNAFPALIELKLNCERSKVGSSLCFSGLILPQLESIDFGSCPFTENCLLALTDRCRNLKEICAPQYINCSDAEMMQVATHCPQLQSLIVGNAEDVTDSTISGLVRNCTRLRTLSLPRVDFGLAVTVLRSTLLTTLNVPGSEISDDELRLIAQNCPNLQRVNLYGCANISDSGVVSLAENCADLRELQGGVSSFMHTEMGVLSDVSVFALAQHCKKLECLEIISATEFVDCGCLIELSRQCPGLKKFALTGTQDELGAALAEILNSCPQFESFRLVSRSLDIIPPLPPKAVYSKMRELNVSDLAFKASSLVALARCCPNLARLDLSSNALITTDNVIQIVQQCRRLENLSLADCAKVTDDAMVAIAPILGRHLVSLELSSCPLMTNLSVQMAAEHCPRLRSLTLIDFPKLSGAALSQALLVNDIYLVTLQVQFCSGVGQSALRGYAARYPLCQLIC